MMGCRTCFLQRDTGARRAGRGLLEPLPLRAKPALRRWPGEILHPNAEHPVCIQLSDLEIRRHLLEGKYT